MKEFYKNPNFYLIIVPLAALIWAITTSTVLFASANDEWEKRKADFEKSQPIIKNILRLDPERINNLNKQKKNAGKFDYNMVIAKFADAHGIPATGYSLRASGRSRRGGQLTQSATLTIDNIKITPFSRFLTELLYVWPDLECEKLTLKKQNTGPDAWEAQLHYKYTLKK